MKAWPICFSLLKQVACRALSRAWAKTGKRIAARMAIMAITTSSSMRVKPRCFFIGASPSLFSGCLSDNRINPRIPRILQARRVVGRGEPQAGDDLVDRGAHVALDGRAEHARHVTHPGVEPA